MKIAVVADTHLHSGLASKLSAKTTAFLQAADIVLHAGDVVSRRALEEFEELNKTYAVLGNNDHELRGVLPETRVLDLESLVIAMIHDAGPRQGRPARLYSKFPTANVVVFGHSHIPCNEVGLNGQLLVNPGSPTQRRGQPEHTVASLVIEGDVLLSHEIKIV